VQKALPIFADGGSIILNASIVVEDLIEVLLGDLAERANATTAAAAWL
jgi:hypothetical protein